jgi:DNA-binding transcriptional MerR regulator
MALRQPVRSKGNVARSKTAATAAPATGSREIPDKLYFRIGEVAKLCEVAPYVLRYWESEFSQLKPNKGGTGQRLYRRRDVEMALRVKTLLYDEGYTIAGARQFLKTDLRSKDPQPVVIIDPKIDTSETQTIEKLRGELKALLAMLSQPAAAKSKGAAVQSIRAVKPKPISTRPELGSLFGDPL